MATLLTSESVVVQRAGVRARPVSDDLVLYSPVTDDVTVLDGVGSLVWSLLESPTLIADLIDPLAATFAVDPRVATTDLLALLESLVAADLVAAKPAGP